MSDKTSLRPSEWTRPQQLAAAGYGVWSAFWTLIVGFVLLTPKRVTAAMREQGYPPATILRAAHGASQTAGIIGVCVSAAIGLIIGVLSYRGVRRVFYSAMVYFTFTGLGAFWVPLRPQAHVGEDTLTLVVHAFVNDLPGLLVGGWLIAGLIRYRHAWAQLPALPTAVPR